MTENFSKLMSDIKPQIQKVQGTWRRINTHKNKKWKSPTTLLRHIIFKYRKSNIKKNPKIGQKRKAPLLWKGTEKNYFDFSGSMQTQRMEWVFKMVRKKKSINLELCTLLNYSSRSEGKITTFSDKQKWNLLSAEVPCKKW